MTPGKDRQKKYREGQRALLARSARMEAGLRDMLALLAGNDKPLAVKLRAIAEEALK